MQLRTALAAIVVFGTVGGALAQEHTTRIENRPYYGAVVTIENGVRVYRPIPPTTHLIINPDGLTPLNLGLGSEAVRPQVQAQGSDLFNR
jgi:hypothetical protein